MNLKENIIDSLEKAMAILDSIESAHMKDGRSYINVYICSNQTLEDLRNYVYDAKAEANDLNEVER